MTRPVSRHGSEEPDGPIVPMYPSEVAAPEDTDVSPVRETIVHSGNEPVVQPGVAVVDSATVQQVVAARQRKRFGGVKIGSAFFGWLSATGMAVVLIALLAAGGVAFGVTKTPATGTVSTDTAKTLGVAGGILLLVVLLISYFSGGYVAGRMARFNGFRQGFAVWLWGVLSVLVVGVLAATAGAKYNIFAQMNLPRLPVHEGTVTNAGIIAIGAAALAALVGALFGGLTGMRFHRRVDNAGFDPNVPDREGSEH